MWLFCVPHYGVLLGREEKGERDEGREGEETTISFSLSLHSLCVCVPVVYGAPVPSSLPPSLSVEAAPSVRSVVLLNSAALWGVKERLHTDTAASH